VLLTSLDERDPDFAPRLHEILCDMLLAVATDAVEPSNQEKERVP
jgi:hypothetical protein